jgi:adenylate kinase family enzyme
LGEPRTEQGGSAPNDVRRPAHTTLILVGRFGSGKSTTGHLLARRTGLPYLEIGELVRRQAAEQGRSALDHADQTFAQGQHSEFVSMAVSEAKRVGLPCIVAGPRRPDELQYLRAMLHPTVAIGLSVSEEERSWRLDERGQKNELYAERVRRDTIEEAWGIGRAIETCDFLVASSGQPEVVAAQCLKLWLIVDREVGTPFLECMIVILRMRSGKSWGR